MKPSAIATPIVRPSTPPMKPSTPPTVTSQAPLPEITPSGTPSPNLAGRIYYVRFSGYLTFDTPTSGFYTRGNGKLIGTWNATNRMFTGQWGEPRAFVRCFSKGPTGTHGWGQVQLQFSSDLTRFRGRWNYCRRWPWFKWSGKQRL